MSSTPAIVMVCEFEKNNFMDYGGYIDYIDREETHNEMELKTTNYSEYIEYMDSENRKKAKDKTTVRLFTEDKNDLTKEDKEKIKESYRMAQKKDSILWKDVFSFDNEWLEENGLYNSETKVLNEGLIRESVRNAMADRIDKENLNMPLWTADIHYNTDNIHIHTSLVELEPTKKRGKLKPKTLTNMKSKFINTLVDRSKEFDEINVLIRENIVNRKKDIDTFKDKEMKKKFIEIIKLLPEDKKQWQYGYNSIAKAKPLIDDLSKFYIENYCKEDFKELNKKLDKECEEFKKLYGEGKKNKQKDKYKDYKTNKIDELYKRMGNSFLTEIRSFAKEEGIKLKRLEKSEKEGVYKRTSNVVITKKTINDIKKGFHNELQHVKNKREYHELQREIGIQQRVNEGLEIE